MREKFILMHNNLLNNHHHVNHIHQLITVILFTSNHLTINWYNSFSQINTCIFLAICSTHTNHNNNMIYLIMFRFQITKKFINKLSLHLPMDCWRSSPYIFFKTKPVLLKYHFTLIINKSIVLQTPQMDKWNQYDKQTILNTNITWQFPL